MPVVTCVWCRTCTVIASNGGRTCRICNMVAWCSERCKHEDWVHWSKECIPMAQYEISMPVPRTTTEIDLAWANPASPHPDFEDTLFYLKTSISARSEVFITGPYYPVEAIRFEMRTRLHNEHATPGIYELEKTTVPIQAVKSLTSATPDFPREIKFEILRLKKPEMAAYMRFQPFRPVHKVYPFYNVVFRRSYCERTGAGPKVTYKEKGAEPRFVKDAVLVNVFREERAAITTALRIVQTMIPSSWYYINRGQRGFVKAIVIHGNPFTVTVVRIVRSPDTLDPQENMSFIRENAENV